MELDAELERTLFPYYTVRKGVNGLVHIRHVAYFGHLVARAEIPEKEADIVLGCYLHDIGRGREGKGTHGDIGAIVAGELLQAHFPQADGEKIAYAVKFHDKGLTSNDPVIGSIWDSDRLTLFRVGVIPVEERLSTKSGRSLLSYAERFIMRHLGEYK